MNKKNIAIAILLFASLFVNGVSFIIPIGFCEDDDVATIITTWMPTIVSFAMLGMVLGLVKKYAK